MPSSLVEEELKLDQSEFELNLLLQLEQRIIIDEAIHGLDAVNKFTENLNAPKCPYPHCVNQYYKLVIMDLNMPVMDGFEASEKIQEIQRQFLGPWRKECTIVALTANGDQQDTVQNCLRSGMKEVL